MVFDFYLIKYLSRTFPHPTLRNAPYPSPSSPRVGLQALHDLELPIRPDYATNSATPRWNDGVLKIC
jgi:hypothetical protein